MQREVNLECSNKERTKMKVQKTQEKVFTPVQLNITFETKEEYDVFYDMLQYDASICSIVYGKNYDSRCTLQNVMIGISESL